MSPISADATVFLLDTSAAIPLLVGDHEHHDRTFDALGERSLGLAGHAAFETYSVLTRLPPPARLAPATAQRLLTTNFPHTRFLGSDRAAALLESLAGRGIAGGSVYDAMVGAVAIEHDMILVTRDRRALDTYRELGVSTEVLS